MRIVLLAMSLLLVACNFGPEKTDIVGSWKGQDTKDGIMVFHKNGDFGMLDSHGDSLFKNNQKPVITWETITEIEPHQIYITMKVDGKSDRMPLGIYKIKGNKLILREPITFHRTIGGISLGVSRYEIPKDFSGILKVFSKDVVND